MTQPIRPMLGELELQQVQLIQLDESQVLTRHDVPGLEGDFFQRQGRAGAAVELTGVQSGPEAREGLNGLRDAFRAGEPLTFAADIVSVTELDDVLIDRFEITEHAGLPEAFEYRLRLREYTEAETPDPEVPPPPPPPPKVEPDEGVLVVNVIKEGDPAFDFSTVIVTASGTAPTGEQLPVRTLSNRVDNRWTEDPFPVGQFTCVATAAGMAADGGDLTGSATATVRAGETTEVTIILRDDTALALRFLIHFRFDSAFIEPCLKPVLKQVADFAAANAGMKLLPVGHTDLAGPTDYNQALSERRARSAFAMLRFANDPAAAIAEWNELRQRRTPGVFRSLNDTWGAREYQQMLQDRGFYNGRIDGDHGPGTDAAVRAFQAANSLTETGNVDDATWPVLIEAYLGAENLSVPDNGFLPNCPGEILKWLGCSELDPVKDTQDAWRPNRRTELLFARAEALPADVAEPDTFELPAPGAVASDWCLNDSGTTTRCCFTERYPGIASKETCPAPPPRGNPLIRQAAEAEPSFVVRGSIRFEDGTPYTGQFFVTASDGEYMSGERARTSGGQRAGTPLRDTPGPDGSFAYPDKPKTPGIFILELDADVVARRLGEPLQEAKGPVVCKRLASDSDSFDVVIVDRAVADIIPRIELPRLDGASPTGDPTDNVVVLKKPHTSPARRRVAFIASPSFSGTGTITIEQGADKIQLFRTPAGGTPMQFDGTDNVFSDVEFELLGVMLFAEGGPNPSDDLDDVIVKLQLTVGGSPGFSVTRTLTTVALTLDIAVPRNDPALDPNALSEADKIAPGRHVQIDNPRRDQERALLIVRQARPAAFAGQLELTRLDPRVRVFAADQETPAAGQAALTLPLQLDNSDIPGPPTSPGPLQAGARFWVEADDMGAAPFTSGFQLGIANLESDGDRVTVVPFDVAVSSNLLPFSDRRSPVHVEGILNRLRGSFDFSDLFGDQADQLFRIRADIPNHTGAVTANIRSEEADGTLIEELDLPLVAQSGTTFACANPILAVPHAIPRGEVTFAAPQNIEFIRTRAEGTIRVSLTAPGFTDRGRTSAGVRGRLLEFCTLTIAGATPTINADLATANRVMAQCGIEFRILERKTEDDPDLLDLDQPTCPLTIGGDLLRSDEEKELFALGRDCASNFLVYFVDTANGLFGCSAYPVGQPGVVVADSASAYTFAHEIGHVLHLPHDGRTDNLMTGSGTNSLPGQPRNVRLEPDQCELMDDSGFLVERGDA